MPARQNIHLGLQGGGAHGAFTWGVLDALLEDGRLDFAAISGSSAGAMNAVALADGWMRGGREGARASLEAFWTSLAATLPVESAVHGPDGGVHLAPVLKLWMLWSHVITPAQANPLGLNPLRRLVEAQFEFERLRREAPMRLHVAATRANSGRLRVFRETELTPDVLLASACLPTVFAPPVIEGEPYWDGGYAANPAVFPLLERSDARDVLLVLLAPLEMPRLPDAPTARALHERIAEIAFTAAFRREMQDIVRRGRPRLSWWPWRAGAGGGRRSRFHLVEAQPSLDHLAGETKMAVGLKFFHALRELGRGAGQRWLREDLRHVGRRDGVDMVARFG